MERPCQRTKIDDYSSLDTNTNNTGPVLPMDIVNEILQRLPAKSVAKFVRVSKSWATIIRSNYFINSFSSLRKLEFETQQEPQHRVLYVFNKTKDLSNNKHEDYCTFFSSSSSSVNQGIDNENPSVEFISRMVTQVDGYGGSGTPIYVNGLLNFMFGRTQVISNPSTGKSIVLPLVKSRRKILRRYFGFDPINNEYKVLCIINSMYGGGNRITSYQNQVLTVGSRSVWRELDFWIPHRPQSKGICIHGIIYYLAYEASLQLILVRFDVRSEKFLNQLPCGFVGASASFLNLIKYESKLAMVYRTNFIVIDLWVLEDPEKIKWLKISHVINPWRCLFYDIDILAITSNGGIIYTSYDRDDSFYVIYYDLKNDRHRRVEIKAENGRDSKSFVRVNSFIDYVESVMLL